MSASRKVEKTNPNPPRRMESGSRSTLGEADLCLVGSFTYHRRAPESYLSPLIVDTLSPTLGCLPGAVPAPSEHAEHFAAHDGNEIRRRNEGE